MKISERPIRKRGYYRALKRGDEWAVKISKMTGLQHMFAFAYRNVDIADLMPRPLGIFKAVPQDTVWKTGTIMVPFSYKEEK